jgi:2-dehydro-3-deoxygluconokinase
MLKIALIGECMLELQGQAFGAMQHSFGGDTLNTAAYLARCAGAALSVHYATALGTDSLSQRMMDRWQAERIEVDLIRRIPGRMPGMYMIETDAAGERSFFYWRDSSAAKAYFDLPEATPLEARIAEWDVVYFSGISLAILPPAGRERLFRLLAQVRERGASVAFDNNYRPRLWPDLADAKHWFKRALEISTVALISQDDHEALFGAEYPSDSVEAAELIIKQGEADTRIRTASGWSRIPTERKVAVVDTTAAGDSFAAGYLSKRTLGADPRTACAFGNLLAARVIQYAGAIIPLAAMQDLAAS